jgi:hypothetical protein
MARKFFYICAGLFLLTLTYHRGATTAGAQGAGFASPNEVAALSGVLPNGATIPLPTYADGTPALESDCRWSVSNTYFGAGDTWCYTADALYGTPPNIYENASYFNSHPGRVMNAGHAGSGGTYDGNYIIIATRGASQPTSALHQSWGQVKARYHSTPGVSVTPGADNR